MIITADTIRRFPFANRVTRIAPDMELLIAHDMAERAYREGHRKAIPPTIASKEAQKDATRRRIMSDALNCLETHGPKHFNAIRDIVRRDTAGLGDALEQLVMAGVVTSDQRKINGGGIRTVYSIANSPTPGACDPAQPGNPTGTRSDVTTAAPLTQPGALNQPPVTQEATR
jgi:hypothetical protein